MASNMLGGSIRLSKQLTKSEALKLFREGKLAPVIEPTETQDNSLTVCEDKTPTLNSEKKLTPETSPSIKVFQPIQKPQQLTEDQKSLGRTLLERLNGLEKLW